MQRTQLTVEQEWTEGGWDWRTNTFQSNVSSAIWRFSTFSPRWKRKQIYTHLYLLFGLPGFIFSPSQPPILYPPFIVCYIFTIWIVVCLELTLWICDSAQMIYLCVFLSLAELCELVAEFVVVCIAMKWYFRTLIISWRLRQIWNYCLLWVSPRADKLYLMLCAHVNGLHGNDERCQLSVYLSSMHIEPSYAHLIGDDVDST